MSTSALSQYRRLGSKNTTGSWQAIACWVIAYASGALDGVMTRSPAVCAKYASGDSLWCSTAPMPPPYGIRIVIGIGVVPPERALMLGDLGHDLVERRVDEPVELDLDDRAVAAHRQADRGAEDPALGQRGIDHAGFAEVLLQPVGHAEDPTELADVLPHQQHLRVRLESAAQRRVDRLGHGHDGHQRPPPTAASCSWNEEWYAAACARSSVDERVRLGVHVLEHRVDVRVGERPAAGPQLHGQRLRLDLDGLEEVMVRQAVPGEVDADPLDRVLELPGLELGGDPVAGGVVGGGVSAHPVREGLDEHRAVALPGARPGPPS